MRTASRSPTTSNSAHPMKRPLTCTGTSLLCTHLVSRMESVSSSINSRARISGIGKSRVSVQGRWTSSPHSSSSRCGLTLCNRVLALRHRSPLDQKLREIDVVNASGGQPVLQGLQQVGFQLCLSGRQQQIVGFSRGKDANDRVARGGNQYPAGRNNWRQSPVLLELQDRFQSSEGTRFWIASINCECVEVQNGRVQFIWG